MKDALQNLLQKIVSQYVRQQGISLPEGFEVELNLSKDPSHGDWTTPVAFRLAQLVKKNPKSVAEEILSGFEPAGLVTRWEVAGGGFINFYVPSAQLAEVLGEIHEKDTRYGESNEGRGKKVLIEFVSANPTGPLTIAHGRQAAVGDALARILTAGGFKVTKEYYLNDSGRQIDLLGESLWVRYRELFGESGEIPEEGYRGEYLKEIAQELQKKKGEGLLKQTREEAIRECAVFAVKEIFNGIKKDLDEIHVEFDSYFPERTLTEKKKVEEALEFLRKKNLVYEEEGAVWFRSTQWGDDKDRVLRKKTGDYTYLAPDIAYHWDKFKRGFEWLVNLWGPDHHGYVPRLKAACQALGHSPDQVTIRIVQLTTLYRQGEPVRMSTRAGEFVTLRELFEEVGRDVTRFFFLLRRVESHLDFDMDLAKNESEENPVYYLQYAHARISSILKFAKRRVQGKVELGRLKELESVDLLKRLREYPSVLVEAAESLEPYRVVEYLRELAAQFHKFYALHRVVTEDEELTSARLLLADGVRIVLRNGLALLGISHPETM